jgi:hypothetical protein
MNPVARGSGKQGGHSRASHLLLHKAFLHNHTHVLVQQQVPNLVTWATFSTCNAAQTIGNLY